MQDREKKEEHREKNIGQEGRNGLERRTGLETDRQEDREEKLWREAFYQELDAVKRQQMLKELPRKSGLWKSCGLQDTGREDQKKMHL